MQGALGHAAARAQSGSHISGKGWGKEKSGSEPRRRCRSPGPAGSPGPHPHRQGWAAGSAAPGRGAAPALPGTGPRAGPAAQPARRQHQPSADQRAQGSGIISSPRTAAPPQTAAERPVALENEASERALLFDRRVTGTFTQQLQRRSNGPAAGARTDPRNAGCAQELLQAVHRLYALYTDHTHNLHTLYRPYTGCTQAVHTLYRLYTGCTQTTH